MPLDVDLRASALGFAGALVALSVLLVFVGLDRVLGALARADPLPAVGTLVFAGLWLTAWGLALRAVLLALGRPVSARRAVFVFVGATFANNVTPFGQAGGEPISALLIGRATDVEYETGLAAIASVDTLNFVPGISIAVVGLAYVATEAALGVRLRLAAVTVGVLAVLVPLAALAAWRWRRRLQRRLGAAIAPVVRRVARVVPRWSPPSVATVRRRVAGFVRAIERVATDREQLAAALALSTLGWFAQAGALWFAIDAVGPRVALAPVVVVVPVAAIAGVTPLPGGLGGVEAALVGLLVALTPLAAPVATAAVLVSRTATYWLPTVAGGVVAGLVGGGAVALETD